MHFRLETIPRHVAATLWSCLIAPRPIGLISTRDPEGVPNIAPYSSLVLLANRPPMLGVSFGAGEGWEKNTFANIEATRVFAVNLVPRFLAETMNQAAEGRDKQDDFARLGLLRDECGTIECPRVADTPATLECRVSEILPLPPSRCHFVTAEITGVYLAEDYMSMDVGFDTMAADLLASVGPEDYVSLRGEKLFLPKLWG